MYLNNNNTLVDLSDNCNIKCKWNIKTTITPSAENTPSRENLDIQNIDNSTLNLIVRNDVIFNDGNKPIILSSNNSNESGTFTLITQNSQYILIPGYANYQYSIDNKPILYMCDATYNNNNVSVIINNNYSINSSVAYFTFIPV